MADILSQSRSELIAKAAADHKLYAGFARQGAFFESVGFMIKNPANSGRNIYLLDFFVGGVSGTVIFTFGPRTASLTNVSTTKGSLSTGSSLSTVAEITSVGTGSGHATTPIGHFSAETGSVSFFADDETGGGGIRTGSVILLQPGQGWVYDSGSTLTTFAGTFIWAEFDI